MKRLLRSLLELVSLHSTQALSLESCSSSKEGGWPSVINHFARLSLIFFAVIACNETNENRSINSDTPKEGERIITSQTIDMGCTKKDNPEVNDKVKRISNKFDLTPQEVTSILPKKFLEELDLDKEYKVNEEGCIKAKQHVADNKEEIKKAISEQSKKYNDKLNNRNIVHSKKDAGIFGINTTIIVLTIMILLTVLTIKGHTLVFTGFGLILFFILAFLMAASFGLIW